MTRRLRIAALFLLLAGSGPAWAVQPDEIHADPAMEQTAREISAELRCLVCQNQSIDDSDAPLARDLRLIVRERLKAGDDHDAVIDFVVARYGEFILLRPRLTAKTTLLWLAPLLLLAGGLYLAYRVFRRTTGPAAMPAPAPLTDAERKKLCAILGKTGE